MVKPTIESILQHHGQALMSGNIEEVLKDYTNDSVFFTPEGTYRGLDGIRKGFAGVTQILTPEVVANFKTIKQDIQGEYIYMTWTALPSIPFGSDTFHIHDGKIMMQSVAHSSGH